ncbi:MAG: cation:proton antiporter [bacterium]|nr:cation:proton antiporter [bacterium]
MEENTLRIFQELLLIAGIGVVAAIILRRLHLPVITILLITGAITGPYGLSLVHDKKLIEGFAEVGVILLLFSIGLEFSIKKLLRIGKLVTLGGFLQVGLTILITLLVTVYGSNYPISQGLLWGFIVALSSTAIVLSALDERSEIDTPHGKFIVGILIFQDLCVIPMMLLIPVFVQTSETFSVIPVVWALSKAILVIGFTLIVSKWIIPMFLKQVDRTQSREIFLLSVLLVCIGTAWVTSLIGSSLALGAFLAGMVIAETDYAQRATSDILPIRDIFTSFFFISLGMLFNFEVVLEQWGLIAIIVIAIIFGKAWITILAGFAMRFPPVVAVLAGFGLAQFSEFGFVLAKAGNNVGLISENEMQILLASGIITMLITPILIRFSPHLAIGASKLKKLERIIGARGIDEPAPTHKKIKDHIILVGYGVGGKVLAKALKQENLPFLIIEMNADLVKEARREGMPAYYGDIASEEAIEMAHVHSSKALVLMINDQRAVERAIVTAHRLAPEVPIYVRSRRLVQVPYLKKLGAKLVIVEEVEAGIAMLAKILKLTNLSPSQQLEHVQAARDTIKLEYYKEL